MTGLSYCTLDLMLHEIRVLALEAGSRGDEIRCQLKTISLDERPDYEALSYVWGDPAVQKEVWVNDSPILVGANLESALRRLRPVHKSRVIWADALCINQQDLDERECQVTLMGRIYEQCQRVHIWLGEEDDIPFVMQPLPTLLHEYAQPKTILRFVDYIKSNNIRTVSPFKSKLSVINCGPHLDVPAAITLLRLLASGAHFYELPFYKIVDFPEFALCEIWANTRCSLINLLSRPWWTWVWTIQEALLPSEATVHIGMYQIKLQIFLDAQGNIARHLFDSDCCTSVCSTMWDSRQSGISLNEAFAQVAPLSKTLSLCRKEDLTDWEAMAAHLSLAQQKQATDPHDYIYGLLGIFPTKFLGGAFPDYRLKSSILFARATKQLLAADTSLKMLCLNASPYTASPDLPSWCIDWGGKVSYFLKFEHGAQYPCGSFKRYEPVHSSADDVLVIEGTLVSSVAILPKPISDVWNLQIITATLTSWQESAYQDDQIDEASFWRTVFYHHRGDSLGVSRGDGRSMKDSNDLATVKVWWTWLQSIAPSTKWFWNIGQFPDGLYDCHMDFMSNYPTPVPKAANSTLQFSGVNGHFFVTEKGKTGVAPPGIARGDQVFICKGSPQLLLLRPCVGTMPKGVDAKDVDKCYTYLGTCYVDGIMDGSAVEGDVEWKKLILC